MYSQMFRRETARHLLAVAGQVTEAYNDRRALWLDAGLRPNEHAIKMAIEMIVAAIAGDESARHDHYRAQQTIEYLERGIPPIAVLAAADLLYETILSFLTPDQRELVGPILDADRVTRQQVVRDYLLRSLAPTGV